MDNGFHGIETELDNLQIEIQGANSRNAQLGAVRRLADKIECTEDCFRSIISGGSNVGCNIVYKTDNDCRLALVENELLAKTTTGGASTDTEVRQLTYWMEN